MVGSPPEPVSSNSVVLRYTFTIFVHLTETELRIRQALLRSMSKPFERLTIVGHSKPALFVPSSEPELGLGIALHRRPTYHSSASP